MGSIAYSNSLVSESTLKQAFTPGTLNDGSKTDYGFGWVIEKDKMGTTKTWHNGGWWVPDTNQS